MSFLACTRAQARIDARDELSDAERLELEEHLAGCAECRAYTTLVAETRALLASGALPSLSPRARARTIERALSERGEERASGAGTGRRIGLAAVAAFGGAAVVLWLVMARTENAPSARDLVRAGEGAPKPGVLLPNHPTPVDSGARLHVAHAQLHVEQPSLLTWDPARGVLRVDGGVLDIDVDPRAGRPFEIARARYSVRVLGTRFVVREESVDVSRGAVRILAPDGRVLVERLEAGGSWTLGANAHAAMLVVAPPEEGRGTAAAGRVIPVPERLRRARLLLAERRSAEARAQIEAALRGGPTRSEQAEARTLLAEHALVTGCIERAISLYVEVGRRYRDLAAGDNALYAAARMRARAGPASDARDLFEEYLATYPRGRFRRDAALRVSSERVSSEREVAP